MQSLEEWKRERERFEEYCRTMLHPPLKRIDVDREIDRLYGELKGPFNALDRTRRRLVKLAIRERGWPADFAIGWYLRGRRGEG